MAWNVKPLEWEAVTDQIPKHAFAAYTPFNRWLIVCEFLSMNHMVYRFGGQDYETLDAAKAAAQADYRTRILSALHPSPEHKEEVTEELSDETVFDMVTELREVYEISTGQTIDDAVMLRRALEKALTSAGVKVAS